MDHLEWINKFGSPAIIACSPSAAKFVLQADDKFFLDWPSVEIVGSNSLVAVEGAAHTRIRSFVMKSINQADPLRRIALMLQPRIISALHSWSQMGRIQVFKEVKKECILLAWSEGLFWITLDKLFTGIVNGVRANPINIPGIAFYHAIQCRKKANAIFEEEMEKRKKEDNTHASTRNDLLDGLMRLKDDEGKHLRDIDVLDNIVSLVVAGFESTSATIMWAVYHLAKSPHVLQKLRKEHIGLNKKNGDFITSDEISKLSYTNKVVDEVIRMANIAPLLFRTAKSDVDYKGYRIPIGWKVICLLRYIHTSPENFENPNCFNPDRWNDPPKPGTYLPFGGGAKDVCRKYARSFASVYYSSSYGSWVQYLVFGGGLRISAGNMLAHYMYLFFSIIWFLGTGCPEWELTNPEAGMIYLPHPKPIDGVEISITKL